MRDRLVEAACHYSHKNAQKECMRLERLFFGAQAFKLMRYSSLEKR